MEAGGNSVSPPQAEGVVGLKTQALVHLGLGLNSSHPASFYEILAQQFNFANTQVPCL